MARKRSRRERKRDHKKRAPADQLLQQGRQKLDEGYPPEAIDCLRQARHEDGNLKGLNALLSCAYSERARQLAAKGMTSEAAAIRSLGDQQYATIDSQALSAGDFQRYIRHLNSAEALQVYVSRPA